MLNDVLKAHLLKEFRQTIKGVSVSEANEMRAGEIYIKQNQLQQMDRQTERLRDEIAELRKLNVEAELKKKTESE